MDDIRKTTLKHMLKLFCAAAVSAAVIMALICFGGEYAHDIKAHLQTAEIMKSCEDFNTLKSGGATVYYTEKDSEYARIAGGIINTYLPLLCNDFELDITPKVTLIIYPGEEEMYAAIGYAAKEGKPAPMGAYSAGIITVLSPSYWVSQKSGQDEIDYFLSNGPVIHELSHLVLDKKTNGNCKEWFSEGTALFYENKYTGYKIQLKKSPVTYTELSSGFKYLNEKESYQKSFQIIKYIDGLDDNTLKKIYARLERGKSLEAALRKELGPYYFALDNL